MTLGVAGRNAEGRVTGRTGVMAGYGGVGGVRSGRTGVGGQ